MTRAVALPRVVVHRREVFPAAFRDRHPQPGDWHRRVTGPCRVMEGDRLAIVSLNLRDYGVDLAPLLAVVHRLPFNKFARISGIPRDSTGQVAASCAAAALAALRAVARASRASRAWALTRPEAPRACRHSTAAPTCAAQGHPQGQSTAGGGRCPVWLALAGQKRKRSLYQPCLYHRHLPLTVGFCL